MCLANMCLHLAVNNAHSASTNGSRWSFYAHVCFLPEVDHPLDGCPSLRRQLHRDQ